MKNLYCQHCELYPNQIIKRYIEPIEDVETWDRETGTYKFSQSNHPSHIDIIDGWPVDTEPAAISLCGICTRKLAYVPDESDENWATKHLI